MTVDEYETIRLIDFEDFTQEECAQQMNLPVLRYKLFIVKSRKKLARP